MTSMPLLFVSIIWYRKCKRYREYSSITVNGKRFGELLALGPTKSIDKCCYGTVARFDFPRMNLGVTSEKRLL